MIEDGTDVKKAGRNRLFVGELNII